MSRFIKLNETTLVESAVETCIAYTIPNDNAFITLWTPVDIYDISGTFYFHTIFDDITAQPDIEIRLTKRDDTFILFTLPVNRNHLIVGGHIKKVECRTVNATPSDPNAQVEFVLDNHFFMQSYIQV